MRSAIFHLLPPLFGPIRVLQAVIRSSLLLVKFCSDKFLKVICSFMFHVVSIVSPNWRGTPTMLSDSVSLTHNTAT